MKSTTQSSPSGRRLLTVVKQPVDTVALSNVDLLSPGSTINGHALRRFDRVLLTSQTDSSENGTYGYDGDELKPAIDWLNEEGQQVVVTGGSLAGNEYIYANSSWRQPSKVSSDVSVADWGVSNALYFDNTNGKWFKDSAKTIEADDDAWKFRAARDYLTILGGGKIKVPAGVWYFKSFEATGKFREMVFPADNITIEGDGDASIIFIAPGLNTVAAGGYNVFALLYATSLITITNFHVKNLAFDFNSDFNQYPVNWTDVLGHQNCGVDVDKAINCSVVDCLFKNHNGQKCVTLGAYGAIQWSSDVRVIGCRFENMSNDANMTNPATSGDQSWIAIGALSYTVVRNRLYGSSLAKRTATAIEIHGLTGICNNNTGNTFNRLINVAADFGEVTDTSVCGNIVSDAATGIALWMMTTYNMHRVRVSGNILELNVDSEGLQEFGIATIASGTGYLSDTDISDNTLIYVGATQSPNNLGIQIGCQIDNVRVTRNAIRNFSDYAIAAYATLLAAGAGNMAKGLVIRDNDILDCGSYPIQLVGRLGETSDVFINPEVTGNRIVSVAVPMNYGVTISGRSVNAIVENTVTDALNGEYILQPGYGSSDVRLLSSNRLYVHAKQNIHPIGPWIFGFHAEQLYVPTAPDAIASPSVMFTGYATRTSDNTVQKVEMSWQAQPFGYTTRSVPRMTLSANVAAEGWLKPLIISCYPALTLIHGGIPGAPLSLGVGGDSIGFRGTSVTIPTVTGSRGGNAALASLLTALASQGLLVDSTSA